MHFLAIFEGPPKPEDEYIKILVHFYILEEQSSLWLWKFCIKKKTKKVAMKCKKEYIHKEKLKLILEKHACKFSYSILRNGGRCQVHGI